MADRAGGHVTTLRPALRADESEARLLERFTAHGVLRDVERLSHDGFLDVLLQRRFLSLQFAVVYDIGIDGLTDPTAIGLVREILREEYPDPAGATPSHREDLVDDLLTLGVTRAQVLGSRPTAVTARVIEDTLSIMLAAAEEDGDAGVLTMLRFWGEVLVSVEYGEFWRRMAPSFAIAGTSSRFYHPHHHHDGREPLAAASQSSCTHSGRLGACLVAELASDADVARFAATEQRLLDTRLRFYDQFSA